MRTTLTAIATAATLLAATATGAIADGHNAWKLDGENSKIAFGSIKKDSIGETHHFSGLSGMVSENGEMTVTINLASVETWIDIRNERMLEHVFRNAPEATLTASLDMDKLNAIPENGTGTVSVDAKLSLLGMDIPVEADMFVIHLDEDTVIAVTDELVWLSTEELGIDAGIDKLQELAKLPSITRAVPVTARLVFEK